LTGLLGDVGTIEWTRRTRGILGRGEKARFLAATVLVTSRVLPRLLVSRGKGSGPDPSRLTPPDSAFAGEVVEACADLDPMVVEHGYRSYLYGRALGMAEGIECDEEGLFAATMFHDYAFETMESLTDCCFTFAGAEVAAEFLEGSPLSEELRHDVLDAITLHLNPSVDPEKPLQRLAHDGIALDVLGMRGWELDGEGVRRVAERHPRHGFTVRGRSLLRNHARNVRGCRSAALFTAGFGPALRVSPWHAADA
jgi:hypothetical protein